MAAASPGPLRRAGYRVFRAIPPRPSHAIIRALTPTYSVGAVALIDWQGRLLALRQTHRHGMSLPGGLVARGEQPAQTVTREVREETGLVIDPGDSFATVFDPWVRHVDVIFTVECVTQPMVRPASEATGYDWLDPTDWDDSDRATLRILDAARAARHTPSPGRVLD